MQTLSVGTTSVLLDDDTASAIIWYSVQLANADRTECVEVQGFDLQEQPVTAQLVLGSTADVSAMTAHTDLAEPDNSEVRRRIQEDSDRLENPPHAQPAEAHVPAGVHDL